MSNLIPITTKKRKYNNIKTSSKRKTFIDEKFGSGFRSALIPSKQSPSIHGLIFRNFWKILNALGVSFEIQEILEVVTGTANMTS